MVVAAQPTNSSNSSSSCSQISRRDLGSMAAALSVAQLLSTLPAVAEGEAAPQQYVDPEDAFKLALPTNWQSSEVCLLLLDTVSAPAGRCCTSRPDSIACCCLCIVAVIIVSRSNRLAQSMPEAATCPAAPYYSVVSSGSAPGQQLLHWGVRDTPHNRLVPIRRTCRPGQRHTDYHKHKCVHKKLAAELWRSMHVLAHMAPWLARLTCLGSRQCLGTPEAPSTNQLCCVHSDARLVSPASTLAWKLTLVLLSCMCAGVEFTKLGSFGNVFAFGTNLVNSMDRSFLLRMRNAMPADGEPVQVAKLLDANETR